MVLKQTAKKETAEGVEHFPREGRRRKECRVGYSLEGNLPNKLLRMGGEVRMPSCLVLEAQRRGRSETAGNERSTRKPVEILREMSRHVIYICTGTNN